MFNFTVPIPLSLYIHIPWCIRKCPYCDFNSHMIKDSIPESAYVDALLADLEQELPKIWGRRLTSIFIGGGTPSLFSPEALDRILSGVRAYLPFPATTEITLEANPGTVEQTRFIGFRQAGINRLSLGIQSLQNDKLKALGRIHDSQTAIQAVLAAKAAGFDNFNLDLMFGLPQQTIDDALHDLHSALQLAPAHLSWYQLTLEPNTQFFHKPPPLPKDEAIWRMQQQGMQVLKNAGYHQYEVSAFSQTNKQCLHNRNYWEFGDYLGIGAGAHSKLTDFNQQQVTRFWKFKQPKAYLNVDTPFTAEVQTISAAEMPFEFMLNALRLQQSIPFSLFEERTGLPRKALEVPLQKAQQKSLLTYSNFSLHLTDLGQRFLNDVVELFLNS